jgi:23S rRNA (adenine2503-C2)-methyltransferase
MRDVLSLTFQELKNDEFFKTLPSFRAKQVFSWLHSKNVSSFDEMMNLSKDLREKLKTKFSINGVKLLKKLESKIDGTVKYLFELSDNELIETVLLRSDRGLSVCISTEVGCKMGCKFCASTKAGFSRKLSAGEMLSQVYFAGKDSGERIGSVMLMGIGEPLDNLDEVLKFLEIISDPEGLNLSNRHISVSTCGLIPEINLLADKKLQITLSLSLHAPFDDMRSEMMPINDIYPIKPLIETCDNYLNKTGRRISVEYTVIKGKNDTDACAKRLAELLKGKLYHINLIPLNEIKEKPFEAASKSEAFAFQSKLIKLGLNATVRRRLGADIDAACGQLRRDEEKRK